MSSERTLRLEQWTKRLVVLLAGVATLLIWGVFLAGAWSDRESQVNLESEKLSRTAAIIGSAVDHLVGESRLGLELLTRQVAAHPTEDPAASPEFLGLVAVLRDHAGGELDVQAVTRSGRLVAFGGSALPLGVADRDIIRLPAGQGLYLGAPEPSGPKGEWGFPVTMAMPEGIGSLARLFVIIHFDELDDLIASLNDRDGETISIYRDDGLLLFRWPLPREFPSNLQPEEWAAIRSVRTDRGEIEGTVHRAFRRGSESSTWLVVSRSEDTLSPGWERWFGIQLGWMSILTMAFLGGAGGLLLLQARLRRLRVTQEELARIDQLTGLLNRRAFLDRCAVELRRQERSPTPMVLAILDLDHFKQVNDRFGHLSGDQALRDFGAALVRTVRPTDLLARIGGEEFAVMLPDTPISTAVEVAERLRREVEKIGLPEGNLSTSVGVAQWTAEETFDQWYHRADRALYEAKHGGRNRVVAAESALEERPLFQRESD